MLARGILLVALLAACASSKVRARFTSENVAQLRQGMKVQEAVALFGPPTRVEGFTTATSRGQKFIYDVGPRSRDVNLLIFTFSGSDRVLSQWMITRVTR